MKKKPKERLSVFDIGATSLGDLPSVLGDRNTASMLTAAFNEWMRRYIKEPERFEREFQSVTEFQKQELKGKSPSYGASCALYLVQILAELAVAKPRAKRKVPKVRARR